MSSQTATIVVTDLVGSTERRVALGEERAEVQRRVHDRLLTEAVTGHGGVVVKGLGDGVLALFSGAAEAVGAAVAIQLAIGAHGHRHPDDRMSVRIGISAGDVTLEDDDCFGTPVVEASRLCADAGGDEILVADLVRLLGRGRGDHQFVPAGERVLKGLPEPVPVALVTWRREAQPAAPLPSALQVGQWFPFAGRVAERNLLVERWKAAAAGESGLVVVSGEPGIGKTRLVSELAATAHEAGATVLYGRSEEELDIPYRPWAEALQHLVTHLPPEILAAHLDDHGPDIGHLVPSVAEPLAAGSDPDTERLRLFGAVLDLLTRAGEEAPVLVVLDDLHWADESSLLLLRHLVRHRGPARLLAMGTYRDTDLSRSHPLAAALADLRREAGVERVALAGLGPDEVEAFLTLAGGGDVNPDEVATLAGMVSAETEGNPFFIGEVLAHLAETGALVQHDGRWQSDQSLIEQIGLPEGIREVVGRRLADLPDTTNELLRVAAIVGPAFDAAVLASAVGQDIDAVLGGIDGAVTRRLVVESDEALDRFRFAHTLVRQTLLEEVTTSRRVRFHHRVALALEAEHAPVADLAHHFGEAAAFDDAAKAVTYTGLAADEAESRLAYEQAVRFRRLAVEAEELIEPADPARRAGLLLDLGDSRNTVGDNVAGRDDFVAAADLARRCGRSDLFGRAAYAYGGDTAVWLDFGDTIGPALLDEALAALPEEPSVERAMCLAQRSLWRTLDADNAERRRLADAALTMARSVGDSRAYFYAIVAMAQALIAEGEIEVLHAVIDDFARLADAAGDEYQRTQVRYLRATEHFLSNDVDGVRRSLAEMQETDPSRMSPVNRWSVVCIAANLAILEGRWDDVMVPDADDTLAVGITGGSVPANHHWRSLDGRGETTASVEASRSMARDHAVSVSVWPNDAWQSSMSDEPQASAARLEAWHRDTFPVIPAAFRAHVVAFAGRIAARVGCRRLHSDLTAELRPKRGQWASWSPEVADHLVDHVLGVLDLTFGDASVGEEELRTAIEDYRRAGTRARVTEALADLAVLTDDTDARTEALDLANELGMRGITARLTS